MNRKEVITYRLSQWWLGAQQAVACARALQIPFGSRTADGHALSLGTHRLLREPSIPALAKPQVLPGPEAVQLQLLLPPETLPHGTWVGRGCLHGRGGRGSVVQQQQFAALPLLQQTLRRPLLTIDSCARTWQLLRPRLGGEAGRSLNLPEFLLAGAIQLQQLRHVARLFTGGCRLGQQHKEPWHRYCVSHVCPDRLSLSGFDPDLTRLVRSVDVPKRVYHRNGTWLRGAESRYLVIQEVSRATDES